MVEEVEDMGKNKKEKYGQYMTPPIMTKFMCSLLENRKNMRILEPCAGNGAFVYNLMENGYSNIDAFEIDEELINNKKVIKNLNFLEVDTNVKYDVVIGNPPYVRWKNLEVELQDYLLNNVLWNEYFNMMCDYSYIFILKAIMHLNVGGELIFITPTYWMSTNYGAVIRDYMMENGFLKDIYIFEEIKVFEGVNVSLTVFHYVKSNKKHSFFNYHVYNKSNVSFLREQAAENFNSIKVKNFEVKENWVFLPCDEKEEIDYFVKSCTNESNVISLLGDKCDIANGMVSGLDKAFYVDDDCAYSALEKGQMIEVLKAKDLSRYTYKSKSKYIFIKYKDEQKLINETPNIYAKLLPFKEKLESRYDYGNGIKYWEWSFERNINFFQNGKQKIFVPGKDRINKTNQFRFCISDKNIYATQDVVSIQAKDSTKENIYYITAFLNSKLVYNWYKHNGVVKGNVVEFSAKATAKIPFLSINFKREKEVIIYEKIVDVVHNRPSDIDTLLEELFNDLLKEKNDSKL